MHKSSLYGMIGLTGLLLSTAAQAVVPLAGGMALRANAYVSRIIDGQSVSISNAVLDTDQWSSAPETLSVSAQSYSTNPAGGFWTASGSAVGTWASATQGQISFQNYGYTFALSNGDGAVYGVQTSGFVDINNRYDWQYRFRAEGNGSITINYDILLASGSGFGLYGWNIDFNGLSILSPNIVSNPAASGQLTRNFLAGQDITIGLNSNRVIGTGAFDYSGPINSSGYINGAFSWSISESDVPPPPPPSVPEPSSWLMLIGGFGLIGLRMRRQKQKRSKPA